MEKFDNIQFARKWFSETKNRFPDDADPVLQELMRFFAAYVAFNALYATFKLENTGDRTAIDRFLKQTQRHYGKYPLLNALRKMDRNHCEIEEKVSVFETKSHHWLDRGNEYESDNTLRVFQRIHSIRCNLFHGMKDPYNPDRKRDLWLIKESRTIMEDFLEWYFRNLDFTTAHTHT